MINWQPDKKMLCVCVWKGQEQHSDWQPGSGRPLAASPANVYIPHDQLLFIS